MMNPESLRCQCGHHAREHDRETWLCKAPGCTTCATFAVHIPAPGGLFDFACMRCGHAEGEHRTKGDSGSRCSIDGCDCTRLASCLWPEGRQMVAAALDAEAASKSEDAGLPASASDRVVVTYPGEHQKGKEVMRLAAALYDDVVARWGAGACVTIEGATWRVEVSRRPLV